MPRKPELSVMLSIIGCVLLGAVDERNAMADLDATPLNQMRAAAEDLAENMPALAPGGGRSVQHPGSVQRPTSHSAKEALLALVRAAVRSEVEREVAQALAGRDSVRSEGIRRGTGDSNNGDNAREAAAQARISAAQALQARLNRNNEQRVNPPPPRAPNTLKN